MAKKKYKTSEYQLYKIVISFFICFPYLVFSNNVIAVLIFHILIKCFSQTIFSWYYWDTMLHKVNFSWGNCWPFPTLCHCKELNSMNFEILKVKLPWTCYMIHNSRYLINQAFMYLTKSTSLLWRKRILTLSGGISLTKPVSDLG